MPRRSVQAIATDFEERVRSFFKANKFSDVDGGTNFVLGVQIDACAGYEETVLIVECKTGPSKGRPLLDDIRILRGKMAQIREAAGKDPRYEKYPNFVFVIATNFEIRDIDEREAAGRDRIFLWDETFLSYYEDLLGKIGEYAKYNLLAELGVSPRVSQRIQLPAFRANIGSEQVFVFLTNPKEMLKWVYVARREIGREKYYQRLVNSSRLTSIASYIKRQGYFPNAAVLGFAVEPEFKPFKDVNTEFPAWSQNFEFGSLSFPGTFRSFWIVDGQHRMYGFSRAGAETCVMPFVALHGLQFEQQAQLFIDINKNQKQVSPDLVWDLEGEMRPNSPDGIISRVAKGLNKEGPLGGRIRIPLEGVSRGRGKLKLTGICRAIRKKRLTAQFLPDRVQNPLFENDPDELVRNTTRILTQAFQIADALFDDRNKQEFWYGNAGVAVFIDLIARVCSRKRDTPDSEDFKKYFGPLKGYMERYRTTEDFAKLRKRCSSEGGRDEVVSDLVRVIRKQTNDIHFSPDIPEFAADDRIRSVERQLARTIARLLQNKSGNWFKERVPSGVQQDVKEAKAKDKAAGGPLEEYLTLGQIIEIVGRKDNWPIVEEAFLRGGFGNLEEVRHAITTVNRLRGRIVHGRASLDDADQMLLDGYLQKLENVVRRTT